MAILDYQNWLDSWNELSARQRSAVGNKIDLPGVGIGNVYWVVQSSKAFYTDFYNSHQTQYSDGSWSVYPDAGTGDGIAAAIAVCKGGRNDYIIVGTGNYNLTTAITLTGKSSVHLIGLNGGGCDVGTPGAAALTQTGNFANITMEAYGEVSGFQIINKAGYSAITVPANTWRVNIHNNTFWTTGTANNIIDATGALAASHGYICRNRFSNTLDTTAIINTGTGTGLTISNNIITQYNGTADYGIKVAGAQCIVNDNIISNSGKAGVITIAIDIYQYSAAISNRCAVDAGKALNGGTAASSFVDNMDGASGTGNGTASNLET